MVEIFNSICESLSIEFGIELVFFFVFFIIFWHQKKNVCIDLHNNNNNILRIKRDEVLRFKHYINVTVNYHELPYFIPFIKINKKKEIKKVGVSSASL